MRVRVCEELASLEHNCNRIIQDNSINLGRTDRTLSPSAIPDFLESHAMESEDEGVPFPPPLSPSSVCRRTKEREGEEG